MFYDVSPLITTVTTSLSMVFQHRPQSFHVNCDRRHPSILLRVIEPLQLHYQRCRSFRDHRRCNWQINESLRTTHSWLASMHRQMRLGKPAVNVYYDFCNGKLERGYLLHWWPIRKQNDHRVTCSCVAKTTEERKCLLCLQVGPTQTVHWHYFWFHSNSTVMLYALKKSSAAEQDDSSNPHVVMWIIGILFGW